MNDDQFLYDFQQPPRPDFSRKLLGRMLRVEPARTVVLRRLAWGIFAAVFLLGLTSLIVPSARAYAQNLVYQIGHRLLTNAPTYAEQYEVALQTATPTASSSPVAVEWQANPVLSMEEAGQQAGFTVAELTGVPEKMVLVTRMVNQPDAQNPYIVVISTYQSAGQTLTLRQLAYLPDIEAHTLPVGSSPIQEVQVRGSAGLWVESLRLSTYLTENMQVAPQAASLLLWSEAPFEFELHANPGLPLDEMLRLADAMILK